MRPVVLCVFFTCLLLLAVHAVGRPKHTPIEVDLTGVERVDCAFVASPGASPQYTVGTGIAISPSRVITAAHLIPPGASRAICAVRGELTVEVTRDEHLDYAVLELPHNALQARAIDCQPLQTDTPYAAVGWAHGERLVQRSVDYITTVPLDKGRASIAHVSAFIEPGMSGGPVFDPQGAVVGIVLSGSEDAQFGGVRPIVETSICH